MREGQVLGGEGGGTTLTEAQVPATHASLKQPTRATVLRWETTSYFRTLCVSRTLAEVLGQKESFMVPVNPQQAAYQLLTTSNQEGPCHLSPGILHTVRDLLPHLC